MDTVDESSLTSAHDVPIAYMQRTREYYAALGYGEPYRWAHFAEVPFHRLGQAAGAVPRGDRHHRGAVSARMR